MKRRATIVLIAMVAILLISGIAGVIKNSFSSKNNDNQADNNPDMGGNISADDYYTYNDVERVVRYLANDDDTAKELDKLVDPLIKSQYITVGYLKDVVNLINAPESVYEFILADKQRDAYVTKREFESVYANIEREGIVDNLTRVDMFVYDVWDVETDSGKKQYTYNKCEKYEVDGDIPEKYMNCVISAYVKNGVLFHIVDLSEEHVSLGCALLLSVIDGNCTFIYNGVTMTLPVNSVATELDATGYSGGGMLVSVELNSAGVISVTPLEEAFSGQVTKADEDGIRVKDIGVIALDDEFSVFDLSGQAFYESSYPVMTGHSQVKIYQRNGKAIAVIIEDELVSENIRVILNNSDYTSYDMPNAVLQSETGFTITHKDETVENIEPGQEVVITPETYEDGEKLVCEPLEGGSIQIKSINRECGNPKYQGKLELRFSNGSINIINELPLEEYLYNVVANEMPLITEPEALKVMAVCARGYAYTKMNDGSYSSHNADLDDSSACQVYNNVGTTPESTKAVKDTYGLVPTHEGALIYPVYYSTSCGVSCTNEEIWGGTAYEYLEANLETIKKEKIDLSSEEDFIDFMKTSKGYDTIEKDMPFYRWQIEFSTSDISTAINSNLKERIEMSENGIKVKVGEDSYEVRDIDTIGEVQSINVTERSRSGVVLALEIVGTEATIKVTGQTNIRNLITPVNQDIVKQDGSVLNGWTSLPSPFYYVQHVEDRFVIYGGGFGHGAGMSKNGANILAKEGYNYKYILAHYYSYVDYKSIYNITDIETESEE